MKKTRLLFIAIACILLSLTGCFHHGADSKYVKYDSYELACDGNDCDSNYFYLNFRNNGSEPLKSPYVRFVIKDTSDKMFKPILFSDSKTINDIPPYTSFTIKLYAGNFQLSSEVGKSKVYFSWTNKKGKKSVRRSVSY